MVSQAATAKVMSENTANDVVSNLDSIDLQAFPSVRSGSYADIGPRRFMEDEHIRIDDLSTCLGNSLPTPSAFYGVFDGHGGSEAAAYMKNNVIRLFFQNSEMVQEDGVEESLRKAFLLADSTLADDTSISTSSGTTALTALLLGRLLVVANAGDCRAVLCRKGEAINMSQDHRPTFPAERSRVEHLGAFVDDGYLNGVISVTRSLGDWDMKSQHGASSPLISDPEIRKTILNEEDEFLIIGCDGIFDVMSSQQAVTFARRGLRRHDDPEQCAKDLVRKALSYNTYDNLTVVVVCFRSMGHRRDKTPQQKLRCCIFPRG